MGIALAILLSKSQSSETIQTPEEKYKGDVNNLISSNISTAEQSLEAAKLKREQTHQSDTENYKLADEDVQLKEQRLANLIAGKEGAQYHLLLKKLLPSELQPSLNKEWEEVVSKFNEDRVNEAAKHKKILAELKDLGFI